MESHRSGSFKLFPDAEGILQYDVEHGLADRDMEEAEKRIAPALAEARRETKNSVGGKFSTPTTRSYRR